MGWNTVLPDQNFRFCGQKASLFCIWKPVLLQCLFLNRATKLSICSHQSLNKKKAFPFDEPLTFVLCCTKKNTWRRLLFVEEFYRAKPALQSFSSGVSFPKKNRRFKKRKKSIAKRSDKFFGLFFCYNKICFCPWSFFTWKKIIVFFEKKQKKCKSFPTVEMFYSKSFGKKLKTLRLYASYYEFCLIWRFFSQRIYFCSPKPNVFFVFFLSQGLYFTFSKKDIFFLVFYFKNFCVSKNKVNPLIKKNPLYFMRSSQQHATFSKTTCEYKLSNQISFLN